MNTRAFCATLGIACALLLHAAPASAGSAAPADEYFGRMKMSVLGITNVIHDVNIHERYNPEMASNWYSKLADAEDAMQDWARLYPSDDWIPKRSYEMSHLFWRMNTPDADLAAGRCRALLLTNFSQSEYAAKARDESAADFRSATVSTRVP